MRMQSISSTERRTVNTHSINFMTATKAFSQIGIRSGPLIFILVLLLVGGSSFAQVAISSESSGASATAATGAPVTITLQDALQRARVNDPQYRSAIMDLGLAREDRVRTRSFSISARTSRTAAKLPMRT